MFTWSAQPLFGRPWLITQLSRFALHAYAPLVAIVVVLAALPRRYPARLILALIWAGSIALTLKQTYDGVSPFARVGLVNNASMNGCLIAALTPLVMGMFKRSWILWGLALLASGSVLLTGTSQPVVILAACAMLLVFRQNGNRWLPTLLYSGAAIVGGFILSSDDFFRSNNRVINWQYFFSWWESQATWWGGTLGRTCYVLLEQIQMLVEAKGGPGLRSMSGTYLWMHSDWLQLLFEYGAIGLALGVVLFGDLLKRAWDRPHLFASWCGFGAMMVANYPLRMPVHTLAFALVAWLIYEDSGRLESR